MKPRIYDNECLDTSTRKYAYDFDYLMHDYMIKTFLPFFKGERALELGCYHGMFTQQIAKYFPDVTVVEASSSSIKIAKSNTPINTLFLESTFETVNLDQASFDAIFIIHTLEHLNNPNIILNKVREWLKPTGFLFIAVPNGNALSRQIAVKMGLINFNTSISNGEHEHGHTRTYTLDALEFEVKNAGFNIESSGGIFLKCLANFQIDDALKNGIIDLAYLDGCFELGKKYPDFCSSIFTICRNTRKENSQLS
jgi:2-polyprenyl-3-methyl-5-hydroxy-6-metoxy-1,4-benzoquinol methylase